MIAARTTPTGPIDKALRGPIIGAPPSIEWVAVDRLNVDPEYQRATDTRQSRTVILRMVKSWQWTLCQPLAVSRRADGSLWVLDGQHRVEGARQRGDIPHLPCCVVQDLDKQAEAKTFVAINTERQKLSEADKFAGMLAAGDADAHAVGELLRETGWTIRRTSNTAIYGPGDLECAPMLVRELRYKGEARLRFALLTLRAAYIDTPVRQAATMLKALIELLPRIEAPAHNITTAHLVEVLGNTPPTGWIHRGAAHRERNNWLTNIAAVTQVILQAVAPQAVKPTVTLAPSPPPALKPTAHQTPFNPEGKAFCVQCDKLVSRATASACGSKFCKLRPFT